MEPSTKSQQEFRSTDYALCLPPRGSPPLGYDCLPVTPASPLPPVRTATTPQPNSLPPLSPPFGPPPPVEPVGDYEERPIRPIGRVATTITNTPGWGWKWFRSDIFSLLLVFSPFAIAGGVRGWSPQTVFALNALSLAGLEVFISTRLERACFSSVGPRCLRSLCLEICPSIFPTLVGVVSLLSDETAVAKSFIIGNVLNNILLGTGAALFMGGISPEESYNQEISETTFELIKLSMFSTSPIIIVWAMIFVMTNQTELPSDYPGSEQFNNATGNATSTASTAASTEAAVTGLSRGASLLLLTVYIAWLIFRRVTHSRYFAADDKDRRAVAIALGNRERIPLPNKRQQKEDGRVYPTWSEKALCKTPFLKIVFRFLTSIAVVAAMVTAVFCCHYLVTSIDPLVGSPANSDEESHGSSSSLRRHFLASVILPLVGNLYNDLRAAELACCGGRNVTLAVHMTYGAGTASIFLTLPLLVIIGWLSSHALLLDFAAFDVSLLAGSVWATSVLTTGNVDYFRGFVFLCLYCVVGLAIFMFKE